MAANPVFPLYYNDIDRSTRDWTDEEFGCYVRLLMHQWDKGEIPKESQRLARIVTSLDKNWLLIRSKFIETETGMFNEKLEEIRAERSAFSKKQSENGKKGGRKAKLNPTINPNINPKESLHNEDEDEVVNRKGSMREKQLLIPINIPFVEFWNHYDKKVGPRDKLEKKWLALSDTEREKAIEHITAYKKAQPDKQYRKDPSTYLNNKSFNDEIITTYGNQTNRPGPQLGTSHARIEGLHALK